MRPTNNPMIIGTDASPKTWTWLCSQNVWSKAIPPNITANAMTIPPVISASESNSAKETGDGIYIYDVIMKKKL